MADGVEAIKKARKTYLIVLLSLMGLSAATVLVAWIPLWFPYLDPGKIGFDRADLIIGLAIASVKAFLVGYIFMHLNHEKKSIYWIFFGSLVMGFVGLMYITFCALEDPIIFEGFFKGEPVLRYDK